MLCFFITYDIDDLRVYFKKNSVSRYPEAERFLAKELFFVLFFIDLIDDFVGLLAGFFGNGVYDAACGAGAGHAELIAGEEAYDDQDGGKPPAQEEDEDEGDQGELHHGFIFVGDFEVVVFALFDQRTDPAEGGGNLAADFAGVYAADGLFDGLGRFSVFLNIYGLFKGLGGLILFEGNNGVQHVPVGLFQRLTGFLIRYAGLFADFFNHFKSGHCIYCLLNGFCAFKLRPSAHCTYYNTRNRASLQPF